MSLYAGRVRGLQMTRAQEDADRRQRELEAQNFAAQQEAQRQAQRQVLADQTAAQDRELGLKRQQEQDAAMAEERAMRHSEAGLRIENTKEDLAGRREARQMAGEDRAAQAGLNTARAEKVSKEVSELDMKAEQKRLRDAAIDQADGIEAIMDDNTPWSKNQDTLKMNGIANAAHNSDDTYTITMIDGRVFQRVTRDQLKAQAKRIRENAKMKYTTKDGSKAKETDPSVIADREARTEQTRLSSEMSRRKAEAEIERARLKLDQANDDVVKAQADVEGSFFNGSAKKTLEEKKRALKEAQSALAIAEKEFGYGQSTTGLPPAPPPVQSQEVVPPQQAIPAGMPQAGTIRQRTLKDGTVVNVRLLPNGQWETVK